MIEAFVFSFDDYYPLGGWIDCRKIAPLTEAIEWATAAEDLDSNLGICIVGPDSEFTVVLEHFYGSVQCPDGTGDMCHVFFLGDVAREYYLRASIHDNRVSGQFYLRHRMENMEEVTPEEAARRIMAERGE